MNIDLPGGGEVIGIGVDIIEVERIQSAHERHGERFINRIFTEEEREYCFNMKNPYPHLAARFAAKEAVSKAFTTGIGRYLRGTSVSIFKVARDQPLVRLDVKGMELLNCVGGKVVLVTLAHTRTYANAVATLLK